MASNTQYIHDDVRDYNEDVRDYLHEYDHTMSLEDRATLFANNFKNFSTPSNPGDKTNPDDGDDYDDVLLNENTMSAEDKDIIVEKMRRDLQWKTLLSKEDGTSLQKNSVPKIHADSLWKTATDLFYNELGASGGKNKDGTATIEEAISELKIAQTKLSKEYGDHELFHGVKIKLGSVLKRLELISQVGDAATKFAPETVSLAWAGFRFIFMGFVEDQKACEFLVEAVDSMSNIILICQIYAQRYQLDVPNPTSTRNEDGLQRGIKTAIIELYRIVLTLSHQAKSFSARKAGKGGRIFWKWLGSQESNFTDTMKSGQKELLELLNLASIAFEEAAIQVLRDLVIGDNEHLQVLKDISDTIQSIAATLNNINLRQNRHDLEKRYKEQLAWLRSGTIAAAETHGRLHEVTKNASCKNACKWIFNETTFKKWSQCEGEDRLLWMKGRSGIGKSFLVSTIIEYLEEHTPKSGTQPLVLYFFCKTGDDTTQRGNKIMLHLLAQILARVFSNFKEENPHSGLDGNGLRSSSFAEQELISCINVIKTARRKMLSSATKEDSSPVEINSLLQPMFKSLVATLQMKFVVVLDALDECLDYDKGLLSALVDLAQSSTMRVFIASRPIDNISKALSNNVLSIDLDLKHSIAENIQVYVKDFLRRENLFAGSNNDLLKAARRITKKADGSFRYANLILEELKSTPNITKQHKLIKSELPDGLKNYYRQAFKGLDSETREILLIALRWLVVAEEFDRKWEVHEDNDGLDDLSLVSDAKSLLSENSDLETTTMLQIRAESIPVSRLKAPTIAERQVIQLVENAGRKFLQFGSANSIELDHNSVRDYIHEDENDRDTTTLCIRCRKEKNDMLVFEAGGKYGKLLMIEKIMKTLNSELFQREFMWAIGVEDDTGGAGSESESKAPETDTVFRKTLLTSRSRQASNAQDIEEVEEQYMENPETNTRVIMNDLEHFHYYKANLIPDELEERYELDHWTGHLRDAEEAWPENERLEEGARWTELYDAVEKFLDPSSWAFKNWVKRTSPWRSMDSIDPLHVAAYCGLVGLIKRHTKEKYSDAWTGNNLSALHLACHGVGQFRGIEILLPDEKNINRRVGMYQQTPLQLAIKSKANVKLVAKLIDAGANYQISDSFGRTCLHFAAESGDTDITKLLLEKNADVNAKDKEGETPLHWACKQQKTPPELVQLLLDYESNVNAEDNDRQTPIYEACLSGNVMVSRILLQNSANANCIDKFGNTVLYAALGWCQTAEKSNVNLAELLVRYGADFSIKDNRLHDPVARAVALNDLRILDFLLKYWKEKDPEGCFLLNRDFDSMTPLHRAAAQGRDEVVKMLLEAGNRKILTLCRLPGIYDSTALHLAVKNGHKEIVKILFDASDASISLEIDKCGATPMHWAASRGNVEIVRILLDKGDISALYIHDKAGATPLHCAVTMGHVETLRVLLDDSDSSAIDEVDHEGATPLHIAARGGNTDAANLLCSRGADPTLEDEHHRTPLEWMFIVWKGIHPDDITRRDNIESTIKLLMSKFLTSAPPAIDLKKHKLDLVHFAIEKGNVNICYAIHKDLVNEKDSHGWTSVLLAAQLQRQEIVDFLSQYDTQNILGTLSQRTDSQSFGHPPTKWSLTCKTSRITISEDGLEASLESSDDLGFHGPVRANHPIPAGREKYYFEVTVLEIFGENQSFRLGVAPRRTHWFDEASAWDYEVTSPLYALDTALSDEIQQYKTGDVIGCGIDFREEKIFYTKNGELLTSKTKSIQVARRLFPCIQMGGKKINTRVNFEQELFEYQKWPFNFPKDNSESEGEDSISGRPTKDSLEAQTVTRLLIEKNVIEVQADHKKEGQILDKIQQSDRQDKIPIELQAADRQEQVPIEPAPIHQEDCDAIGKSQLNHQGTQKEIKTGIGGINPAVDTVEIFESLATLQAPQKRKKFSRVLRKLGFCS
ncbi:hypothetical protein BELL_0979g00010 [Botrytis elliptica]|uniref:B30.2/SPRY domain-containing protein n=1 Tax=Botrytis elliptica TaxID=278938 RepID=A0A4Z1JAV3_9HELO|nr:hypothetical protein EAE99_005411 [Botrytis elliptica]TGO66087.1 hypothetical protein BELL_0979g00010 [Botrytis elliptica]